MKNTTSKKLTIGLAVFYFILTGFGQMAHAQSEVRFRLVHDTVIVVSMTANGEGPFDFVLDTGTNSTIVDPAVAQKLGLTPLGRLTLITVGGQQTVVRSTFRSLALGATSAKDVEVLVQDLGEMRKLDSHIAGIVGQNFLGQFNYLVDLKKRSIRFELGDDLRNAVQGNAVPVEMVEGRMLVPSELRSPYQAKVRLVLDSGANLLVLFRSASLGANNPSMASQWMSNTGSQQNSAAVGQVGTLAIGAQQFHDVNAAFVPPTPGEPQRAEDGSLPIALFHSIYINNEKQFVVFNPKGGVN